MVQILLWFSFIASCFIAFGLANKCAEVTTSQSAASTEPIKGTPRWAIVALTRPGGKHDLTARNQAIVRVLKKYASLHDITALFFSEFNFPSDIIDKTTQLFDGVAKVKFVNTADRGFSGKEKFGYKVFMIRSIIFQLLLVFSWCSTCASSSVWIFMIT